MKMKDAIEWYNDIARRNGGYRHNIITEQIGVSAEDIFEKELLEIVKGKVVLDAGCGHGEFTMKMAGYAKQIIGIDFAEELVKIANQIKYDKGIENVSFMTINSKEDLPFNDSYFDVIYSRRGPTNIISKSNLLISGGKIVGIHGYPIEHRDMANELKSIGDYTDISIRIHQEAIFYFNNANDYAEYLSASHMSPDYTLHENKNAFNEVLKNSYINGRIAIKERKHIWMATKS